MWSIRVIACYFIVQFVRILSGHNHKAIHAILRFASGLTEDGGHCANSINYRTLHEDQISTGRATRIGAILERGISELHDGSFGVF
jgi:hypothetical protein